MRKALITGASRGIGKACFDKLSSQGFNVLGTYNATPVLAQASSDLDFYKVNLIDQGELSSFCEYLKSSDPPFDTLVLCAGLNKDELILRMNDASFTDVIYGNLTANFKIVKAALPKMVRLRFGRIILISSVVAFMGSPGQTNYAASKAALVGFARSLAREVGSRNITVNIVAPGAINTDMLIGAGQKRIDALRALIPIGYIGEPEDVAGVVGFLATEEARYITGAIIPVDGGLGMGW